MENVEHVVMYSARVALGRQLMTDPNGVIEYEWSCECGNSEGEYPDLESLQQGARAHVGEGETMTVDALARPLILDVE